jgi:succinate dehydrogenase/fumarate reductase-like Fe-S protein
MSQEAVSHEVRSHRGAFQEVELRIYRFDPSTDAGPRYDVFRVPLEGQSTIMNALRYIEDRIDPSIAYYSSCRIGKCMGCLVRANGRPVLACATLVTGDVTLEPVDPDRVIRDLVVASTP